MDEMNITSAQYIRNLDDTENVNISAVIEGVTYSVPIDNGNRHYVEIMRQVNAGTLTIQDAD
jgi:hypothetical protein